MLRADCDLQRADALARLAVRCIHSLFNLTRHMDYWWGFAKKSRYRRRNLREYGRLVPATRSQHLPLLDQPDGDGVTGFLLQ